MLNIRRLGRRTPIFDRAMEKSIGGYAEGVAFLFFS